MSAEVFLLLVFLTAIVATVLYCQRFEFGDAWIIMWIPVAVCSLLLTTVVSTMFLEKVTYQKTIIQIGGCNRNSCGVVMDDNTIGYISMPVIGQKVNFHYWRFK